MRIVTSQIMREVDKFCIEKLNIPSIVLMENAALKILKNLDIEKNEYFIIICGNGNNGGDGLALARHLIILNKKVEVFLIGQDDRLSKDCKINYDILNSMGINIKLINDVNDLDPIRDAIGKSDVIVDAIFGTGLSREIRGIQKLIIHIMNNSNKFIVSVDIPSGLDGDTGEILGVSVKANRTVSFEFYKKGFLFNKADNVTGEIIIEKIGIPQSVADKLGVEDYITEMEQIRKCIPKRRIYDHKGSFGRVNIIAGSNGLTGAAYITTQAAVRSGSGLVTLCCMENIQHTMSIKLTEAMTVSYKDSKSLNDLLKKSDVIAIGPGMGNSEATFKTLSNVLDIAECPLVIDADGINVLNGKLSLLKNTKCKIVLTPHFGEMSRLTGKSIEEIKKNRIEISKKFAEEYGVVLLLKGYNTIITDGKRLLVNPTGNSAMASGGMGDCLTGIIASLIGQGLEPFQATYVGAYIHGYCGDKLSEKMFCVNANHVLENLPYYIKEIENK
ncbi:NAD(P)H-hydrate dehydratase [Clostridium brassicae]|uniref:Bifunctional NAD(P)H-hydrate repair enzyme n=1 Tax=Clostridium brassicae TaxID=2999072 RepID=A0ABT4D5G8_9CLOT|nr:NAD(P)H-hydrate dehydratase [Clostridium brassicae]MCY6957538.1 NAD(P)H-hydrate dehydratase [Clostridium brassicae]